MSAITFISKKENRFDLGLVSFNWLDTHNVFDNYQENSDPYSDIIFQTSSDNVENLSNDIIVCANVDDKIRTDIKEKLVLFSEFVKNSDGVTAYIL